jgi:hypothetical protein
MEMRWAIWGRRTSIRERTSMIAVRGSMIAMRGSMIATRETMRTTLTSIRTVYYTTAYDKISLHYHQGINQSVSLFSNYQSERTRFSKFCWRNKKSVNPPPGSEAARPENVYGTSFILLTLTFLFLLLFLPGAVKRSLI